MTIEEYNSATEDLAALKSAIRQGAKEVYYGDKRVVYRSLDEMIRIRADMETELGLNKNKSRVRYGAFSKGIK